MNRRELTDHLKLVTPSTWRMIAVECGLVKHARGRVSDKLTAAQLAAALMASPSAARRAAALVERSSKDARFLPLVQALKSMKGATSSQAGGWTLTASEQQGNTCVHLTDGHGHARGVITKSLDPRVGLILLSQPDAQTAVQIVPGTLPVAVLKAATVMLS